MFTVFMGTSKFVFTRFLFTGLASQDRASEDSASELLFAKRWKDKGAFRLDAESGPSVPPPVFDSSTMFRQLSTFPRERSILFYLQLQREKHWYVSQLPARVPPSHNRAAAEVAGLGAPARPAPCHPVSNDAFFVAAGGISVFSTFAPAKSWAVPVRRCRQ